MTLSEQIFQEAGVTFRSLERQHNLHLPNGSRLRGVKITLTKLYIARDKKFYRHGSNDLAVEVRDEAVLKTATFQGLVKAIRWLAETRARTMRRSTSVSS